LAKRFFESKKSFGQKKSPQKKKKNLFLKNLVKKYLCTKNFPKEFGVHTFFFLKKLGFKKILSKEFLVKILLYKIEFCYKRIFLKISLKKLGPESFRSEKNFCR